MTSRGESGVGKWTVIVKDTQVNQFNGTFVDWHLKLYGESIDASKAKLLPMPTEQDDDNHADDEISTTTIQGTKSAGHVAPSKTLLPVIPTDHPDRPTKPTKPTGSESQESSTATGEPTSSSSPSSWLPSFFPTFGVSSKTQIWIYGAASLILAFCLGLGVYLFMARRKRLRNNPRDEWEFDLLEEDEAEGLNGGGRTAAAGKKGGKRRAGELYDAFAAGSEDESDGEYQDNGAGGDEREKRLYESDDDGEAQHVIGDDDDSDSEAETEKIPGQGSLGRK